MRKLILLLFILLSLTSFSFEIDKDELNLELDKILGEKKVVYLDDITEGKIFIFDQIKSEEDLTKYQDKIFQIISYLREKKQFELAYISFFIVDERYLFDYTLQLRTAKEELNNAKDFLKYRDEVLSAFESEVSDEKIIENIKKLNKTSLYLYRDNNFVEYSILYHTTVYGPQQWKENGNLQEYRKRNFNKKEDIILYNTLEVLYEYENTNKYYTGEWKEE